MAQYLLLTNDKYREFLDSSTGLKFRVGQRDHFVVYDMELIEGGFLIDVEDTSWENVGGYGDPGDEITGARCRMGVGLTGDWEVDIELTATGFDGDEDTDWKYLGGIDNYWKSFWTRQQFDNGKLVITFDDAARSQYTLGLPLFQTKGIAVTCYVMKSRYVDDAQYMQSSELLAMHNAGMDIQNHTYDHLYGTPNILDLNEIEYLEQIQLLSDKLVTEGITAPKHGSYPGGLVNDNVEKYGSQLMRTGRAGTATGWSPVYRNVDKMKINDYVIDAIDAAGIIALKAEMDAAMTNKYAVITSTHKIGTPAAQTVTEAQLTDIIDYAQTIGMDIITMSELYNLMQPQPVLFNVYATNTTTSYLTWEVDTTIGVKTYIERSTDGINYSEIDIVVDGITTYTDTGLTPGTTYYYRLRLEKGGGYSDYTKVQSAQTFITQSLSFINRSIAAGETMGVKHQGVYNEAIVALDNATLFDDRFDCAYFTKGVGRATTKLNLIKASHNLEEVANGGAIVYAEKTGYASDGTASYIRSHYIPSSDSSKLIQNSGSILWKVVGDLHATIFKGLGASDGTNLIRSVAKGTQSYAAMNGAAILTNAGAVPVNGHNAISRVLSTAFKQWGNALEETKTSNSTGLPAKEIYLLCYNNNDTPASWDDRYHEYLFIGAGISQAEFLVIQGIMNTFFDKI